MPRRAHVYACTQHTPARSFTIPDPTKTAHPRSLQRRKGIFGLVRLDHPSIGLRKGARPSRGSARVLKFFVANLHVHDYRFHVMSACVHWQSVGFLVVVPIPVPSVMLLASTRSAFQAFSLARRSLQALQPKAACSGQPQAAANHTTRTSAPLQQTA